MHEIYFEAFKKFKNILNAIYFNTRRAGSRPKTDRLRLSDSYQIIKKQGCGFTFILFGYIIQIQRYFSKRNQFRIQLLFLFFKCGSGFSFKKMPCRYLMKQGWGNFEEKKQKKARKMEENCNFIIKYLLTKCGQTPLITTFQQSVLSISTGSIFRF